MLIVVKPNRKLSIIALIAVGTLLLGTLVGILFSSTSIINGLLPIANCPPKTLDDIDADFVVRKPSIETLPPSYQLEAVDASNLQDNGDRVVMYYSNNSLCPFPTSETQLIEGEAIAVVVSKGSDAGYSNGTEFQRSELEYLKSKPSTSNKVQTIDINGFKGLRWSPYLEGAVKSSGVVFYHENDDTIYGIYGGQPLDRLTEIARSIPHQ